MCFTHVFLQMSLICISCFRIFFTLIIKHLIVLSMSFFTAAQDSQVCLYHCPFGWSTGFPSFVLNATLPGTGLLGCTCM